MKATQKVLESKAKVRFPDCDPFNHLNNSKYIDYMINAREDHLLQDYELDVHRLAMKEGISWVVGQNQIAYLSSANLMETVTLESRLLSYDEKSLLAEVLMWNEEKTILKAVLWTRYVHVDLRQQKSRPHSKEFMDFFAEVVCPVAADDFESRVKMLRSSLVK
ncbi:MAG: acyl-CoA thioesterase [Bacteroidota bacterium]